ncbi:MAG: hypothetical protein K1X88_03830 [Nannocystaceae bacterium]|nr:hypothetical protein [Nannocystaceae bacterium]
MPILVSTLALFHALTASPVVPNAGGAANKPIEALDPPQVLLPSAAAAAAVASLSSQAAVVARVDADAQPGGPPARLSLTRPASRGARLSASCALWVQPAIDRMSFHPQALGPGCDDRWGAWVEFDAVAGRRYAVECGASRGGWNVMVESIATGWVEHARTHQADTDRPTTLVSLPEDQHVVVVFQPAVGAEQAIGHVGRCQVVALD